MSTSKDKGFLGSISSRMKPKRKPTVKPTQQVSGPSAPTTILGSSAAPSLMPTTTDLVPNTILDAPVLRNNDKSRKLRCVIEREPVVFTVVLPCDSEVDDLKTAIRDRGILLYVASTAWGMWKPKDAHPINMQPADSLAQSIRSLGDHLAQVADKLDPTDSLDSIFPSQPHGEHIHIIVRTVKATEISSYTHQWNALKDLSQFISPVDPKSNQHEAQAGYLLRLDDFSLMLSMSDIDEFSSVFIRECYLIWFKSFCLAVEQRPHGRFALSSTPGCGKTFATNLIFKMVANSKIPHVKSILYHFGTTFYYLHEDKVFSITQELAGMIAIQPGIFYIVDGHDANPVHSKCLTLFIASPRNPNFKHWYYHAQIKPSYFPVWSLDELLQCRALCYQTIKEETVVARFQKYGGVARYVFWQQGDPPSLENVVMDNDTRKSIRYVGEVSQLLSSSHMLLHIAVDDQMHFKHIVLASHHVSILLFSKYYQESLENLKSLLGSGGALAGHLFECYVHFLFEHGHSDPLLCRSLEGDDTEFYLELEQRNMVVFDSLPANLSSSNYYVPLSTKFPAIDAITKKVALQYTVSETHPIKGVQGIETLARLYAGNTLPLLFVVPELIADKFHKQQILTTHGQIPVKMPSVRQFVAGLPLGIDTSIVKRRRLE